MNNKTLAILSTVPIWLTAALGGLGVAMPSIFSIIIWLVGLTLTTWTTVRLWESSDTALPRIVAGLLFVEVWGGALAGNILGVLSVVAYVVLGFSGLILVTWAAVLLYKQPDRKN